MRFLNTERFSPVIHLGDLPWEYDLFHHKVDALPDSKKKLDEFISQNNVSPDIGWWEKQRLRCLNGYSVKDAVEKGGDTFIDGLDCVWNDSAKSLDYAPGITISPESVYLPEYDLTIKQNEVFITGHHYWYLNFWVIFGLLKGGGIKKMVNPRFLDIDWGFFYRVVLMMMKNKGLQETKTRQKGYTSKFSCLLSHFFTHMPSSVNIVAGGVSDDAEKTFRDTITGLDNLRNTQFYKIRSVNRLHDSYIKARYGGAEFMAISCKDNAQAISRFSPTIIIYEELGKWKKGLLKDAKRFVEVSLRAEGKKTGWDISGGTGGDMELGAADLEQMHYNPDSNNLLRFRNKWERETVNGFTAHFTPGWQYTIIDKDGNSLKDESLEYMRKQEDAIDNASDKYIYLTQNANFAADVFRISGGLFFGYTINNFVNERKAYILTHSEAQVVKRYTLRWKYGLRKWWLGVDFVEDSSGPFLISELPVTYREGGQELTCKNLYRAATDSYDQDEAKTSKSKGSCWIKKGFLNANQSYNKYVAGVIIRPGVFEGGSDTFYEYTALLCVAYNAVNLIESRNLLIFNWYHKHGLSSYLKERPGLLVSKYIKNSLASNVYGIDPMFKGDALKILADFLKHKVNIFNIDFIEILTAIAKFRLSKTYNCDIIVSLAYLEALMKDELDYQVENEQSEPCKAPVWKLDKGRLIKSYGDA